MYTYRTKIYPTATQAKSLRHYAHCSRFIWNLCLEQRIMLYDNFRKSVNAFYQNAEVTTILADPANAWLRECPTSVFQNTTKNLDRAYQHFWRKLKQGATWDEAGFPRFKSRYLKPAFKLNGSIKVDGHRIQLPSLKKRIGTVYVKELVLPQGETKAEYLSIVEVAPNQWYLTATIDVSAAREDGNDPWRQPFATVTLDDREFGVHLTDGRAFAYPEHLKSQLDRLAELQRLMQFYARHTKKYQKMREKVARLHHDITNRRQHTHHTISRLLVSECRALRIVKPPIKEILIETRDRPRLTQGLSDVAYSELCRQIDYKSGWFGCTVETVTLESLETVEVL